MRFEDADVDEDNAEAFKVVKEWVGYLYGPKFAGKSPFVYGPTGTGKTHLACCAANLAIDYGYFCRFVRSVDIPRNDQEALMELVDAGSTPVLVLDDLGAEKQTPRFLECLYTIVDGRLWNEAPTVFTSNFTPSRLREVLNSVEDGYGDRLVGRITEACEFVPLGGGDRRKG